MNRQQNQLPQVAFSILLALSLRERHGYEIIKQVKADSDGKISLVPGALYASIKQLKEQGFIVVVDRPDDTRRKYYKMSASGQRILADELEYYQNTIKLARERQILTVHSYNA